MKHPIGIRMAGTLVSVVISLIAVLPIMAVAAPTITIYTDSDTYVAGDTMEVSLSTDNPGPGMSVAVYIGLLTPDGVLYTLGPWGWTNSVQPWISSIFHPGGWGLPRTVFWSFDVPCAMPPGPYVFASVLTHPGTFDFVCDPSFAPFSILTVSDLWVDGVTGNDSNDGSEAFPFLTITHALNVAAGAPGNPVTIHVAACTYAAGTNGETFPLDMESWVSLQGDDQDTTILDAEYAAYHVIYCNNVNNMTVEGFTITGGYASEVGLLDPDACGGGIYLNDSSPTIQDNIVSGNVANRYGGGICCFFMSSPIIQHNTIWANWAKYEGGGGISCMDNSSPVIFNNLIWDNGLTGDFEGGGGIDCRILSSPTIRNNTLVGNETDSGGDGIYCDFDSLPIIADCILWSNGDEFSDDDLYGCSATYCCIEDLDAGVGNIHTSPIFVTGPFGDFYLGPTSLCTDAGSQSAAAAALDGRTTQADGTPDAGTVDMGYHYPIATGEPPSAYIDSISPNPATQGEDTVDFTGHGEDTDGSVVAYEWSSDLDGILSTDEDFSVAAAALSLGSHSISFTVQDDNGLWSVPDTETLVVEPGSDLYVDGDTGSDSNDGSETSPFKTITHALNVAVGSPGNPVTIHVAACTYAAGTNGETFPLDMESWVSLLGDDQDTTILDAEYAAYHVIYCNSVSDLMIEGFTITGGYASEVGLLDPDACGGGIYLNDSSPTIQSNIVSGNTANRYGGGICCFFMSSPTIQHNTISANWAKYEGGGGISCMDNSSPVIFNNLIWDNWLTGDFEGGGGIDCRILSSPTIRDNTLAGNDVDMGGDGIYCDMDSFPTITDCIFWDNGDEWGHDDLFGCSATYCCIEDLDAGVGNIHNNPMFVPGPFGNQYLDPTSLCINAGSQSATAAALDDRTTQVDNTLDTGTVDMGYHYPIAPGEPPTAYIDSISPNPATQGDDTVDFMGHGEDADGSVVAHEWSSDLDGILSTAGDFSIEASALSFGTHTVSYRVQDDTGQWSEPDTETLTIIVCSQFFVNGATGNDANDGSEAFPFKTITRALDVSVGTEECPVLISVAAGTYAASTNGETFPLNMESWVSLSGENQATTVLDAEEAASHVLYCNGVGNLTIEGFTITRGRTAGPATEDYSGGGICCVGSSLTIQSNVILDNWASSNGGGIYCDTSVLTIQNNTIRGNFADSGGGISCRDSSPIIRHNEILENEVIAWGSFSGGGILCYQSSPLILNNLIADNYVVLWDVSGGSGIGCSQNSSPMIRNNTIVGNSGDFSAGIYCWNDSYPTVIDCIIWDNDDDLRNCTATYCCIEDLDAGVWNIHDNPLFVPGPLGDYYLDPASLCINAGSQSAAAAGLDDRTTQIDNSPDASMLDMGYHYPISTGGPPTAYIDSIAPNPATQGYDDVEFMGHGEDTDGSVVAHEWSSDLDGILSTDEDFTIEANALSIGTHVISFRVQDNESLWSVPDTETLSVEACSQFFVNGATGNDSNDGSEAAPFRTITYALAVAVGTEECPVLISVAAGTYAASTNGETFPLNMESWVSIIGDDPNTTTLDAEGAACHVLYCDSVSNLTIEGFTITGGNANGTETSDTYGGGIYCLDSSPFIFNNTISQNSAHTFGGGGGIYCDNSSPTISANTISDNSTGALFGSGGGIYCIDSSPTIEHNTISDNAAGWGGGLACASTGSPTIIDNTISYNAATFGGGLLCSGDTSPHITYNSINLNSAEYGGGIACQFGFPIIEYNAISDNEATGGAGIYCNEEAAQTIQYNTISSNIAVEYGGGIACARSSPTIQHNTISSNWAKYEGGGGISCLDNSSPAIINNLILDNWITSDFSGGGGIDCRESSSPAIQSNTISGNDADIGGDGIFCDATSSPTIINCILWGNGDELFDCSATYCCIEDFDAGTGNIHTDPWFQTGFYGDYYLSSIAAGQASDSDCINMGSQSAIAAGLSDRTTQTDNAPDTGTVDMGYHYPIP